MKLFEAEGDGFLGRTVTGDETRVHYQQPETKKASKEWRHTSSPRHSAHNYCGKGYADSLLG